MVCSNGQSVNNENGDSTAKESCLNVVRFDEIQEKELHWLWPNRIPAGKLTILSSDPGTCKTFVTCDIAARISLGAEWPDDSGHATTGSVMILNSEDDPEDTLKPRLRRHGANLRRVYLIKGTDDRDANGKRIRRSVRFDTDLHQIRAALKQFPDVRLLIVDPITAYLGKSDSYKNAEVRAVLGPLCELAAEFNVTIIGVSHFNKMSGTAAVTRTSGSMAFVAQARSVWTHVPDRDDIDRFLWLPVKMNLAKKPPGLAYRVVDGRVKWEPGEVTISADEALNPATRRIDSGELERAKKFLQQELSHGEVLTTTIEGKLAAACISDATYNRARKELGVLRRKQRGVKNGKWCLSLPSSNTSAPVAPHESVENLESLDNLEPHDSLESLDTLESLQEQGDYLPFELCQESQPTQGSQGVHAVQDVAAGNGCQKRTASGQSRRFG